MQNGMFRPMRDQKWELTARCELRSPAICADRFRIIFFCRLCRREEVWTSYPILRIFILRNLLVRNYRERERERRGFILIGNSFLQCKVLQVETQNLLYVFTLHVSPCSGLDKWRWFQKRRCFGHLILYFSCEVWFNAIFFYKNAFSASLQGNTCWVGQLTLVCGMRLRRLPDITFLIRFWIYLHLSVSA